MDVSIVRGYEAGRAIRDTRRSVVSHRPITGPFLFASRAQLRQLLVKINSLVRTGERRASRRACILTGLISELIDTRFAGITIYLHYRRTTIEQRSQVVLPPFPLLSLSPLLSLFLFFSIPAVHTPPFFPFSLPRIKISAPWNSAWFHRCSIQLVGIVCALCGTT